MLWISISWKISKKQWFWCQAHPWHSQQKYYSPYIFCFQVASTCIQNHQIVFHQPLMNYKICYFFCLIVHLARAIGYRIRVGEGDTKIRQSLGHHKGLIWPWRHCRPHLDESEIKLFHPSIHPLDLDAMPGAAKLVSSCDTKACHHCYYSSMLSIGHWHTRATVMLNSFL